MSWLLECYCQPLWWHVFAGGLSGVTSALLVNGVYSWVMRRRP